jgi:hypothetical protein
MHKLSQPMPKFWLHAVAMTVVSLVAACGGGGGGGGTSALPIPSTVVVEDAAIVNADVTDAIGRAAVSSGRGEYTFLDSNGKSFPPQLPVTVASRNVFVNGSIASGTPITFQDLDRNGVFSAGDIAFNGSFTVRYAERGSSKIYANPVASLVPSSWDGSSAIAGLSPVLLKSAISTSVETSNNAQLKQVTSLLTALSDTLGSTLSSNGMANKQVSSTLANLLVAVGTTTGLNLLDANAATKLGEAAALTVAGAASFIPAGNLSSATTSATNLATNLQRLSVAVSGTLKNYEAMVQVAQNSASLSTTAFDVAAGATDTLNTDVSIQNARAVAVNSLRLVPFCDLIIGQSSACNPSSIGPWLAFDRLTGFRTAGDSDGSVVVSGTGQLFTDFAFSSGLKAQFTSSSNSWKYVGPTANSIEISLGISFKDPSGAAQTGNLLQICNSQGNCVPYYLATAAGVCNLVKTNNVVDQVLLTNINKLNALNTTCSP